VLICDKVIDDVCLKAHFLKDKNDDIFSGPRIVIKFPKTDN
jgi:hypothetical protein